MAFLVKNSVLSLLVLVSFSVICVSAGETETLPVYSRTYDPNRDPFSDLVMATERAEASKRLILLIVGGGWCSWCHTLDRYVENNENFADLFYETFEVVKIYHGPENDNGMFLSKLPKIKGYPHFFVMNANFDVLGSQNTGSLEHRKRFPLSSEQYHDASMQEFLLRWSDHLQMSLGAGL